MFWNLNLKITKIQNFKASKNQNFENSRKRTINLITGGGTCGAGMIAFTQTLHAYQLGNWSLGGMGAERERKGVKWAKRTMYSNFR